MMSGQERNEDVQLVCNMVGDLELDELLLLREKLEDEKEWASLLPEQLNRMDPESRCFLEVAMISLEGRQIILAAIDEQLRR